MDPKKITYEYRHAIDYRPEVITGIWGGVNIRGMIEMNFFTEHRDLPIKSTHLVSEAGKLEGKVDSREPKVDVFIRVVKQGISVDLATAQSIYDWLGEKIDLINTVTKANEKEVSEA